MLGRAVSVVEGVGVLDGETLGVGVFEGVGVAEEDRVAARLGADVAVGLAFARRFDLDDLGAMVGHELRGMRPGQEEREVDDAQAFELHGGAS